MNDDYFNAAFNVLLALIDYEGKVSDKLKSLNFARGFVRAIECGFAPPEAYEMVKTGLGYDEKGNPQEL